MNNNYSSLNPPLQIPSSCVVLTYVSKQENSKHLVFCLLLVGNPGIMCAFVQVSFVGGSISLWSSESFLSRRG